MPSIIDGKSSCRALMWSGSGMRDLRSCSPTKPPCSRRPSLHKPRITDDDALQAQELVEIDRPLARLTDRATPALDTILRRALALDGIARL